MNTKNNNLDSIVSKILENFKPGVCSSCNSNNSPAGHFNACGHGTCDLCFKRSRGKCPVCKMPFKEQKLAEGILSHVEKLKRMSVTKTGSPVIRIFFTPDGGPNKRDFKGETSLHKECRNGKEAQVERLINKGADVNSQDFAGWTPLHEAVLSRQYRVAELLLENGASVNIPGLTYTTPLHIAVQENDINLIKLLVKYGADLSCRNIHGKTPIDLCVNNEEMRDAICLTPRCPHINKIFTVPTPKVFFTDPDRTLTTKLKKATHIMIATKDNLLSAGDVSHVIIGNKKLNTLVIQAAMLQGAYVVRADWVQDFIDKKWGYNPLKHLAAITGFALKNAAMNKVNKLPKLFDGMQFYFCHSNRQKIGGYEYTVQDLKKLVELGGGTVITRTPARFLEENVCFPYHLPVELDVKVTPHYLIYDELQEHSIEKKYSLLEMKRKSTRWLIECINNFSLQY